eukprot:TRINITY_DN3908_c0_g1_i1.p2 TRINITY_DN3908_c0_g1~~TRINITY_DN3908_c0_g1_i1.p2  ORF type:complete len:120 (-),score=33.37 TRINITY_DN3908_c0_g1_i1:709-1068(-)
MFSDPMDVAFNGTDPANVYPNTFFLPSSGVQRGSTFLGDGDPLSPSWTSVKGAYRQEINETENLPKIPSQPIGYGDAKRLLAVMGEQRSQRSGREQSQGSPTDWVLGLMRNIKDGKSVS